MSAAVRRAACIAGALALVSAGSAATALAADGVHYGGETEDGRKVKLVADQRGEVVRGAITAETECTRGFDPFRARVEFRSPLDRSGPGGFRDKGTFLESDDRFSARYKYRVEAERESDRVLVGTFTLTISFRRNEGEYTVCSVEDLVFSAKRSSGD